MATSPHDEHVQLAHVREDLRREFPAVPPDVVEEHLTDVVHAFDDARVRSFVPVLAQRQARQRLRDLDPAR